jgi:hypothetical protein
MSLLRCNTISLHIPPNLLYHAIKQIWIFRKPPQKRHVILCRERQSSILSRFINGQNAVVDSDFVGEFKEQLESSGFLFRLEFGISFESGIFADPNGQEVYDIPDLFECIVFVEDFGR